MSKEIELLERWLDDTIFEPEELDSLMEETKELLAQPEPEPVEDRIARWHRLGYEQGKKASKPEQEPVAWITEWVQRYRHNDTPIIDRAVSFTKGDAPAVPNPNYIPLYLAPPKPEPLSDEYLQQLCERERFAYSISQQLFNAVARRIEKAHGITGVKGNE